MRVLIQKCQSASVTVKNDYHEKIAYGLVLFIGFQKQDKEEYIKYLAKKVANLRIFEDEKGVMNKSLLDVQGEILSISQFTLYANTSSGNRPSYSEAMDFKTAQAFYEKWNSELQKYAPTKVGIFGADMLISIENIGPTTIILEKEENPR